MKIAVFTDTFFPAINGVVTATDNLVKGLADNGHEVILISPEFKNNNTLQYKRICHVTCRGVPVFVLADFKTTLPLNWKLYKTLKLFNPDIIHFQTPWTVGLQAIAMARILQKPLVGTFHTFLFDPDYLKNIKILHNRQFAKFADKYCLYYYNKCDIVTAPSVSTLKTLQTTGLQKPVKYISNGISSSGFDNSKSEIFREKYAAKGQTLFLYVGRVAPEKNLVFLIRAFKELVRHNKNCRLVMIGDGPDFQLIQELIKKEALVNNIVMLGRLPHEEILKSGIYKACDAFITASKTENQPMTILEAQLNGLPCICMDARGLPDLVSNERNGLVSAVDDLQDFSANLIRFADDKYLASRLSRDSLKTVKQHDLKCVIKSWEDLYSKLLLTSKEEMIS